MGQQGAPASGMPTGEGDTGRRGVLTGGEGSRQRLNVGRWSALAAGLAGFVSLCVGYLGVSAEGGSLRDQLSYIASGGLFGLFLLGVAATVAIVNGIADQATATREVRDILLLLYGDLSEEATGSAGAPSEVEVDLASGGPFEEGTLLTMGGSRRAHRAGCALLAGKDGLRPVTEAEAARAGLSPCRVCEPEFSASDAVPMS